MSQHNWIAYGLAFLRVAIGLIFLDSGSRKLRDPAGTVGLVKALGFIPDPVTFVAVLGPLELVVGILLITGLLTRPISAFVALFMLSNLIVFGIPAVPALAKLPVYPLIRIAVMKDLVIMAGAISLVLAETQPASLDALVFKRKS